MCSGSGSCQERVIHAVLHSPSRPRAASALMSALFGNPWQQGAKKNSVGSRVRVEERGVVVVLVRFRYHW